MTIDTTVRKLNEMHMSTMAECFMEQMSSIEYQQLSFEERFTLMVDREWDNRQSNRLKRLIKSAGFRDQGACIENIVYSAERKLDRKLIAELSACNYIIEPHNVLLLGATGTGKSYIAQALGVAAARQFIPVKYVRLPDLLADLKIARDNGTYRKMMAFLQKIQLLILDEWLLYPLTEDDAQLILEIVDIRNRKASTIFCSQYSVPGWREKLQNKILADAVCDRIAHDSYEIIIDSKESMRKMTGLKRKFE